MKPVIYQIFTRLYGNDCPSCRPWGSREENGVGRFADIDDRALAAIAKLGVSHVWYTGVIEHASPANSPRTVVKGRAGSPYAISDYYDVNTELATDPARRLDEFRALVERTHRAGLQVLIDFVPNHVARNYASDKKPAGVRDFGADDDPGVAFSAMNNYYWLPGQDFVVPTGIHLPPEPDIGPAWCETPARATGNDVFSASPRADDWYETVKLNYGLDFSRGGLGCFDPIPDTWYKMLDILCYWVDFGVDGFRCDMAEMVPVEFWAWVIPRVKERAAHLVFLAEIYNPDAYWRYIDPGCFDWLYDKVGLYDAIRSVIEGRAGVDRILGAWRTGDALGDRLLAFLENHDEQRLASRFFAGDGRLGRPGMAVCVGLVRGPVMVYFAQELGEAADGESGFSGDDGRTTIFDYWSVPSLRRCRNGGAWDGAGLSQAERELREFYVRLLGLCSQEKALTEGQVRLVPTGYERVLAWYREHGGRKLFFAANFDRESAHVITADEGPVTVGPMDAIIPVLPS